jgi:RNA polymerase sigma factor (sigma-70 family)
MPTPSLPRFLAQLKQSMAAETLTDLSDSELLRRFLTTQDAAAFRALLHRHGPMVFRICRRVLGRDQDAEDAFQAVFLVLACQAGKIRKQTSLACWLHGVAYRTGLAAREALARRRKREAEAGRTVVPARLPDDTTWVELRALLDEELERLPARLRAPLIHCYLEGLTQDEAARQLQHSKATFRRDLDRGRTLLGARLRRRGLALSAALAAPLVTDCSAAAALPAQLCAATIEIAGLIVAGRAVTACVSARVAALMEGVMRPMLFTKTNSIAVILATVVLLGGTLSASMYQTLGQDAGTGAAPTAPAAQAASGQPASQQNGELDGRVKPALRDAEQDALTLDDPFNRAVALGRIAVLYARTGQRDAALQTLQKALDAEGREVGQGREQHRDNRFWIIAEYQVEASDLKGALKTIEGVSEMNQTAALRHVAVAQARRGDIKGALATVGMMKPVRANDPFRDEALRRIAILQADAGNIKGALETVEGLDGTTADKALALAAIVRAQVKAGDRQGATALAEQILKIMPVTGIPRDFGITAYIEAQSALGKDDEARKAVKELADAQWRDGALWRLTAAQAARGAIASAHASASAIADARLQGEAHKAIVSALLQARDLSAAVKAAGEINDDAGRFYAMIEVAKAQAAAGQKTAAAQTLEAALKLADQLIDSARIRGVRAAALAHYAGARATAGDADGAIEWAASQSDTYIRVVARIHVAEALVGSTRK